MNDRLVQSQTVLGPSVDGLSSPPLAQAAEVLWTFLVETRQEHKNHSFEVLGVLARWTRDRAREGLSTAFTASNLKAEVAPKTSKEPPENLQAGLIDATMQQYMQPHRLEPWCDVLARQNYVATVEQMTKSAPARAEAPSAGRSARASRQGAEHTGRSDRRWLAARAGLGGMPTYPLRGPKRVRACANRPPGGPGSAGAVSAARWLAAAALLGLAAGCAVLPPPAPRPLAHAIRDDGTTPLAMTLRPVLPDDGRSGFSLQPYGPNALATRMALIRLAARSLDVQYYLLRGDNTGTALMGALREAAQRGVRVRVLVDDFYTAGEDDMLLALASYPNVQVRLFNPFPAARSADWTRFVASAFDFRRINRRMHNKLLVADDVAAVAGGRNMADEYVMNSAGSNFIDMDAFVAGPLVHDLSREFDTYWNSDVAYDVARVARSALDTAALRLAFEGRVARAVPPQASEVPADGHVEVPQSGAPEVLSPALVGMLNLPYTLERGRPGPLLWAHARVLFDPIAKTEGEYESATSIEGTVTGGVLHWLESARHSIQMVSPYFVPTDRAIANLARATASGLEVTLLTNSLASTDEPWAYFAYWGRIKALLRAGVRIDEISPTLVVERHRLGIFGQRRGALHMKNAIIDGRSVFLGSMNLDQRSAKLNTELGVIIDSPEMAGQLASLADAGSSYRLRLRAGDGAIEWVKAVPGGAPVVYDVPPETTVLQRLWLRLTGPLIPEKDL